MAYSIELRKIQIRDSAVLRARGLMEGTLSLIEDDIRSFGRWSSGFFRKRWKKYHYYENKIWRRVAT